MGTALQIIDAKDFAILQAGGGSLKDVIESNLGGEQLRPSDLDQVKVPTGGATAWTVPGLEGDETTKEIVGVIVFKKDIRGWWPEKGTTGPPSCRSDDGITGIGSPGGNCDKCPHNQWGSATNDAGEPGKGKACKQYRLLFLIRKDAMLPLVVRVPASSIDGIKKYMIRLTTQNVQHNAVLTRLSLAVEKNDAGIKYAKVVATVAGKLGPEEAERFFEYGKSMRGVFDQVSAEQMADDITA